ncbi:trypsin-like peptidase domain-containing protein [Streptomyces sp. Tu 3180]|uniref:trypsin-like peptidase domain-containing protein n=1 Tax=Streptomyces sp. Tu 3180 TaxID=2682611 RepID=UPI001FB5B207|nr:trypsin-like peptidase domain-containing protein [Streptomyces sp. Tu 3180]
MGHHPAADVLVRVQDLAGRPRGTGFVADHHGTVITSHEAVDGLPRLVLHAPGDRHCVVTADAVTPLPALDLALVRSEGLGVAPLPVTARESVETGTYVRIAAGGWREARVLGTSAVTYTATDRFHSLGDALELAIGTAGRDALRLGGGAAGGPVLDATTGAVVGVLGTALRSQGRDSGFAVPLPPRDPGAARAGGATGAEDPLAELLAENAVTVPAYGADLNIAGAVELTAASVRRDGPAPAPGAHTTVEPVERAAVTAEFAAFERGDAAVLGLVGPPGSGRTTQLAELAARRHRAGRPTLWLRGADLHGADGSVADAARRALDRAARTVAASRIPFPAAPDDLGDTGPERLARVARTAGRPLLLLLDGPEEMPPGLAHRLAEWTDGTTRWLRATGARLVVACRAEYWEEAGARFPADLLHAADPRPDGLPPCVGLGDLTPEEARQARARHGIPEGVLADARHPLTLRMLAEVRAALADAADAVPDVPVDRDTVFSAHLDLMCLRIAARLAAGNGPRGTAVRRLAAKVSGQVHEAARRSLGAGRGELDRETFEAVFPPGPAPDRLGGGTGWAAAVLAEGLLVPAGTGYRFAHEEFADWIHGVHLDLDEALRALVHHRRTPPDPDDLPAPVPHHRIGPVVQALLLLARQHGTGHLASRLADLVHALDAHPGSWWAVRLLTGSLARVPDATPYTGVLRMLADRIVAWREQRRTVPRELGPAFWTGLPLPLEARCALLRRLVHADGPPCESGPRFLAAAGRLLAADPVAVLPYLVRWFEDERPLPATPHATVATAAQALLHTHRRAAPDALTEALADSAHRRADQLLTALAEEEPPAVCRAVGRWARDERPARRAAALTYGLRVAPYARDAGDRALLRHAALALLARTDDRGLHGGALALLVRDPGGRDRHLARALEHFAAGDPRFPPSALTDALVTHPEPVLDAFRARLGRAADAGETFRALADATTPGLARPVAALVREAVARRPELAGHVAAHVDRRLDRDTAPAARAVLHPLLTGLLVGGPEALRAALAGVLAGPGTPASHPLRRALLDLLLIRETDPGVLEAVLRAAARNTGPELRVLVHRTGRLLVRTPEGAARFDHGLTDLARHLPGFAAAVAGWLADAPQEWAAVVGPGTRRTIEGLAGVGVPA